MDDFDFRGGWVQSPVVLATAVDIELLVHCLVLEHEQRRERRHHVHRFAECDNCVLVGRGSVGDKSVDFETRPGSWQVAGFGGDIADWQFATELLAVQRAGYGDGFERFCFQRKAGGGRDFLAVGDCLGKGQETDSLSAAVDFQIDQPWCVQR